MWRRLTEQGVMKILEKGWMQQGIYVPNLSHTFHHEARAENTSPYT